MKNNKGFTLTELLVALAVIAILLSEVTSIMFNTASLFKSGTSEVNLQGEAQRVVQISEELLMDANVSVNFTQPDPSSPNNSTIYIKNKNVSTNEVYEYFIRLDKPDDKEYGKLMLSKKVDGKPDAPKEQVLAEYVTGINLDMSNFANADKATLNITMKNKDHKYDITETKDIYFRNMIGTSGNATSPEIAEANYYLDCLRFKKYNLKYDVMGRENCKNKKGNEYTFVWDDKSKSNGCETYYDLSTDGKISCKGSINNNFGREYSAVVLIIDPDSGSDVGKITVTTVPVQIGLGKQATSGTVATGGGIWYFNTDGESSAASVSYIDIKGISLFPDDVYSSTDVSCVFESSYDKIEMPTLEYNVISTKQFKLKDDSNHDSEMTIDLLGYKLDPKTNSVYLSGSKCDYQLKECEKTYTNLLENNQGTIKGKIVIKYSDSVYLSTTAYLVPNGTDGVKTITHYWPVNYSEEKMVIGVPDSFWSNLKFE